MAKKGDSKIFAFLATFFTIVGFIIALLMKKDDKYVMYYAKQGLVVFIASIIAYMANFVLLFIPILGWLAIVVIQITLFVLWLMSWINALSGKMKPIPLIGKYAEKFKF